MSYGVCPGYGIETCGWEGNLRAIAFQMPNAFGAAPMEGQTVPMCLTCRHEFRRQMRSLSATEIRVTEVTSTT